MTPLTNSHRVLLVDLLGFGRSPKPWTTYSVERHLAALRGVLHTSAPLTLRREAEHHPLLRDPEGCLSQLGTFADGLMAQRSEDEHASAQRHVPV